MPNNLNGLPLRHAIEARHESFACDAFQTLLQDRRIAVVHLADGPHPEIDFATAHFAYLRIKGTQEGEPLGYAERDLTRWANTAHAIAEDREVFLFVTRATRSRTPPPRRSCCAG